MDWPSIEDKIQRAVIARLQAIAIAGGFTMDMPDDNVQDHPMGVGWLQNHVPSAQVILGDERPIEEHIRTSEKTLDVHILIFTQNKSEPERERERGIADVKKALYTPNRLDDPDSPGTPLHAICRAVEVSRFIAENRATGNAGAEITALYEYVEGTAL